MSRSLAILNALVDTRNAVAEIQSTDVHGAVLTLTRTSTLAITTASTTITWQSELRDYQFEWSGTSVTIPADGWYIFSLNIQTSAVLNDCLLRIVQAGNNSVHVSMIGDVDRTAFTGTAVVYCTAGQVIAFNLTPSANVNVNVVAEGSPQQSPILHIVQLSGGVDV